MRVAFVALAVLLAGCGGDSAADAGPPDAGADASTDAAPRDAGVDLGPTDSGPIDSGPTDLGVDAAAAMCTPAWHPTACGDCGGSSSAGTCSQGCVPTSCGDGRLYEATCDDATHTCHCMIDGHEACTCTFTTPTTTLGCEPVEFGGSNCCWNVG